MRNGLLATFILVVIAAVSLSAFAPPDTLAQGCAACYQSAAASGPRAAEALRHGILILMAVPLGICVAIGRLAYRRRNR
jgi:hypothetical protein